MRYRISFGYNVIYHVITNSTMQTNEYTAAMFRVIQDGNQHNVPYNPGTYAIASLFMRSDDAPRMQINHVLAVNHDERAALYGMLSVLKSLNPGIVPKLSQY